MEVNMEVKFTQLVGKEDIYNYNMFFFTKKSKMMYFSYIVGFLSLGLGIYYLIKGEIPVGIFCILLFAYLVFLHRLFTKWQIRKMIDRKTDIDNMTVFVEIDEEGFTYSNEEENTSNKLLWDNVLELYDYKNYWYIYYAPNRAVFVRKSDCPNVNSVETMLKEKLSYRYKTVKARD